MSYKQVKTIINPYHSSLLSNKNSKITARNCSLSYLDLRECPWDMPGRDKLERAEKFRSRQRNSKKWSDDSSFYDDYVRRDTWNKVALEKELSYEGSSDTYQDDVSKINSQKVEPRPYHSDLQELEQELLDRDVDEYLDNYVFIESEPVSQDILDIFQEAQDTIFNDSADIHAMGMSKNDAMYSNADLTPVPDVLERQLSRKTYGLDSGGSLALENMFDQPDEPKLSLWDYFGIKK